MSALEVFAFPATGQGAGAIPVDSTLIKGLESHLYVVEFGTRRIKVGVSASPRTRLAQHFRDGANFGHPVTRWWLSGPHIEAAKNERQLIDFCRVMTNQPRGARGEYFELPFTAACDFASDLTMTRGDRAAFDADLKARGEAFRQAILSVRPDPALDLAAMAGLHADWQRHDGFPANTYFQEVVFELTKARIVVAGWSQEEPWDTVIEIGVESYVDGPLSWAEHGLYVCWRCDEMDEPKHPDDFTGLGWYWVPYSKPNTAAGDFAKEFEGLPYLAEPTDVAAAVVDLINPAPTPEVSAA